MEGPPVWQIRGLHVPASWNPGREVEGRKRAPCCPEPAQAGPTESPSARSPPCGPAALLRPSRSPPGPAWADPLSLQGRRSRFPGVQPRSRPRVEARVHSDGHTEEVNRNPAGKRERLGWAPGQVENEPESTHGLRGGSLSPLPAPAGGGHPGVYSTSAPSSGGLSSCLCPHFPLARTGHRPGPSPTCRAASAQAASKHGPSTGPGREGVAGLVRGHSPGRLALGGARPSREASREDGARMRRGGQSCGGRPRVHSARGWPCSSRRTGPLPCGPNS